MKKRISIPLIVAFLFSLCIMPLSAKTGENGYVQIRDDDALTDEELAAIDADFDIYKFVTHVDVYYVEFDSDDHLVEDATNYFNEQNKGPDAIVLAVGPNSHEFVAFGACDGYVSQERYDYIWDAMWQEESLSQALLKYVVKMHAEVYTLKDGGVQTIPDERIKELVEDEANLLSQDEYDQLLDKLTEISNRQGMDVAIVTSYNYTGQSIEAYTDDYYDYNGYGQGVDADGIMLLIDMANREWHISTSGYGITAFTDKGLEYIEGCFQSKLSDGDYIGAFMAFADTCDEFITQAKTGEPYDIGNMPKRPMSLLFIPLALIIGFVLALIPVSLFKSQLRSVKPAIGAANYTDSNGLVLTRDEDRFVHTAVTKTPRPKNTSSSSHGGSSSHHSSSGRSHGGRSGRF